MCRYVSLQMVRPHALRARATHPAQLTCSNGAGAIRNGKLESFTTGSLFTDIPTYNASGPVNCTLLLDVLDWLGQTGAATANITVSTRKVGPRALRPCRSSPSAYAWVQRLCGDSAATRSSQVAGPRHSEPCDMAWCHAPSAGDQPAAARPSHQQRRPERGRTQRRVSQLA